MMFGPSDKESPNSALLLRWRVKRKTNDELRQRFIDMTVPQADSLGVTLPDPLLKLDPATGSYTHGEPNWDEFFQVINGHGPCNRERLEARKKAHLEGAWVREAAQAYAEKHNLSPQKMAA